MSTAAGWYEEPGWSSWVRQWLGSANREARKTGSVKRTAAVTQADAADEKFELPGLEDVADKILFVKAVLDAVPDDKDYLYSDGEPDNSLPGRQLAYALGCDAFSRLPSDPQLLHSLGFSLIELGDYRRALECFLREVQEKPEDGGAWDNIAWCRLKLGSLPDALTASERALSLMPGVPNVYDTHAAILVKMGKLEPAIAIVRRGLGLRPGEVPDLSYQMAVLLEKKGHVQEATTYWRKYLDVVKWDFGHRRAIERVVRKLSRYGQSVAAPNLVRVNKHSLCQRMLLTNLLCLHAFEALEGARRETLEQMKRHVGRFITAMCESYREIGNALLRAGLKGERRLLAEQCNLVSLAALLQDRPDVVRGWLNQSLRLAPGNPNGKALLYGQCIVKVLHGVPDHEEYKLLQEALTLHPKPCHAHILLARHYSLKKRFKALEGLWANVIEAERLHHFSTDERKLYEESVHGVGVWRAAANVIQGKHGDAVGLLSRLLERRPDSTEARFWLTIAYMREGKVAKAREVFQSIPAQALPQEIYRKIRSELTEVSVGLVIHDELLGHLRSPRMTGCSSSPIVCRR